MGMWPEVSVGRAWIWAVPLPVSTGTRTRFFPPAGQGAGTRHGPGSLVMLILTRRVGESLKIGDEVTVTVLGVKGNQIRVGIEAPPEVQVHREEIYQRILKERADGSGETSGDL